MTYIIIDPPITPFSSLEEIEDWIKYLKTMGKNKEVSDALNAANRYLKWEKTELFNEVESQ